MKGELQMGKVISVVSGKGGVGKTVISANLGATLAKKGKKVLLIDLDFGLRNLDIVLGMESMIVYDIADVLGGVCKIRQALIKDMRYKNLYYIAPPQNENKKEITEKHLSALCATLKENFDYIIIDSPAGIKGGFESAVILADLVLLIITAEYPSIRDGEKINELLVQAGKLKRYIIINKIKTEYIRKNICPDIEYIADTVKSEIIGIIQDEPSIEIASNNGIPIVIKEGSYVAKNFSNIGDRIMTKASL